MASGSGIGATIMYGEETTWGTPVTPNKSPEIDSETIDLNKTFLQGFGLHGGGSFPRASRRRASRREVTGTLMLELATRGMGMLIKHVLGSSVVTPTALTAPAYKQVHQVGTTDGMGMTWQVVRPQTDGTNWPFTFNGVKILDMELTVSDGALVTITLTLDGKDQTTATAAASYSPIAATQVFGFADATVFTVGGTASTTSGVVSIATGVPVVSIVKSFKLKLTRSTANARFGVGNGGVKAQQIINGWDVAQVTLDSEWTSHAEFYDRYTAGGIFALQLTLIGDPIGASGSSNTFDIVMPALQIDSAPVHADGPDILGMSVSATILDDGVNNPLQITIISGDATL